MTIGIVDKLVGQSGTSHVQSVSVLADQSTYFDADFGHHVVGGLKCVRGNSAVV